MCEETYHTIGFNDYMAFFKDTKIIDKKFKQSGVELAWVSTLAGERRVKTV